MTSDRWLKGISEGVDGVLEMLEGGFRRQAQDGDPQEICGVVTKWIAELEIESNQAPLFLTRCLDDLIIAGRAEVLLVDRCDVVPRGFEESLGSMPEVFVQLELQ
jgi:hypothetical protein